MCYVLHSEWQLDDVLAAEHILQRKISVFFTYHPKLLEAQISLWGLNELKQI